MNSVEGRQAHLFYQDPEVPRQSQGSGLSTAWINTCSTRKECDLAARRCKPGDGKSSSGRMQQALAASPVNQRSHTHLPARAATRQQARVPKRSRPGRSEEHCREYVGTEREALALGSRSRIALIQTTGGRPFSSSRYPSSSPRPSSSSGPFSWRPPFSWSSPCAPLLSSFPPTSWRRSVSPRPCGCRQL